MFEDTPEVELLDDAIEAASDNVEDESLEERFDELVLFKFLDNSFT